MPDPTFKELVDKAQALIDKTSTQLGTNRQLAEKALATWRTIEETCRKLEQQLTEAKAHLSLLQQQP